MMQERGWWSDERQAAGWLFSSKRFASNDGDPARSRDGDDGEESSAHWPVSSAKA
jgi:hypothetical protein